MDDWPEYKPLVEIVMGEQLEGFKRKPDRSEDSAQKKKEAESEKETAITQDPDGESRYECAVCGRSYKHYFHLKAHKRECSVEPLFRCEECHKRFYHSRNLGRHMQNVHKSPRKKVVLAEQAASQNPAT